MIFSFRGKLVASQEDFYSQFVFQNLDEQDDSLLRYITVTKLPNWDIPRLEIGDIGFVQCEYVDAGDRYYERSTGNTEIYKYTSCYFINFIKEKEKIEKKIYNF